jgi:hypothetical protein
MIDLERGNCKTVLKLDFTAHIALWSLSQNLDSAVRDTGLKHASVFIKESSLR